ncbi:hypothetical protein [Cysteiniphilum halobium]|uniref:hypothetical protein n=1 Tax=Cysteiniphilum halobium TaxID=2219059 RepID=UPI003F8448EF
MTNEPRILEFDDGKLLVAAEEFSHAVLNEDDSIKGYVELKDGRCLKAHRLTGVKNLYFV